MIQCRLWYVPPTKCAGIAQSVEQLIRNQQVVSSSLISSSTKKPYSQEYGFFDCAGYRKIAAERA